MALGKALLSGPEILLMDEPLASLDTPLKLRILAHLERAVAEWDVPAVYVTHAQAEVQRAAQWVVVINRGSLLTAGPPEETLRLVVRDSQDAVPNREGQEASGPTQP